jgi:hypothetical protein
LIDSTDHQQNSRREETKKHHRPQKRLYVCGWKREREEEEEEKERGEVVEAPPRQICESFIRGRTNKQKPPKTFLGFYEGRRELKKAGEYGF